MRTLLLLLMAAPLAVLPATPAAAAECHIMRIGYAVGEGGVVALEPRNDVIAYGDCVSFTNDTAATATVTVGGHYARQVMPSETTSRATSFVGTAPGRQQVTATSGPSSAPGSTAHGSITVGASPSPRPSSSPQSSPPSKPGQPKPGQSSPSPRPAAAPPSTGPSAPGSGPQVAPTPRGGRPTPDRSGNAQQPPVSPAGPIESLPPSPAPPAAVLARGPVEPGSGRGAGLPSALAALAVVGTGAGLARVLLAEPVDSLPTVGGDS